MVEIYESQFLRFYALTKLAFQIDTDNINNVNLFNVK